MNLIIQEITFDEINCSSEGTSFLETGDLEDMQ